MFFPQSKCRAHPRSACTRSATWLLLPHLDNLITSACVLHHLLLMNCSSDADSLRQSQLLHFWVLVLPAACADPAADPATVPLTSAVTSCDLSAAEAVDS